MRLVLALAALLLTPTLALAHTGASPSFGFMHGLAHPIGGLDHVLAMLVVGVFAFVLGGRALMLVPLAFVGTMILGFGLGLQGSGLPLVELGIAASSLVIGMAAAWGRPMPVAAAMALVGAFALFHGYAHGIEMPVDSNGFSYALGFVVATAMLHATGILASLAVAKLVGRHGKLVARVAGAAFAVGGLGVLAGWL